MNRSPVAKISASRLRKLGGIVPFSSIPQQRKSIRKRKPQSAHWNPVPGALDKRSHFTKDGREKLFGVDKTNRRLEIFVRSGGRCEATVTRWKMNSTIHGFYRQERCNAPITWENFEWSHKQHGAKKTDTLAGGIASCKKCHDDFHNGRG